MSITTGGSTVPADFRLLEYYQKKVSWTNTAAARFEQVLVESDPTHAGSEKQLWVFLPKDPEAFTHDVDGNLLQDGRWNYGWDGENRLIWMESRTDLPTAMPRQRVEFGYDFMSRRNVKRMYIPVAVAEIPGGPLGEPETIGATTSVIDGATASVAGPGSDAAAETLPAWAVSAPVGWSQVGLSKYVWDGWNLLAELDITDASVRTFAWGLDLSGSEQGAGGIGGLVLGWTRANGTLGGEANGSGGNTLRYVFDGNGNVMAALDDLGRARAKYEYGPFGETLTSEGDLAADNPIRWSTKYTDGESGLVYYGYRYYNAGTGRWLNRDPIGELGGENLFEFVGNDAQSGFDSLGLKRGPDGEGRGGWGVAPGSLNELQPVLATTTSTYCVMIDEAGFPVWTAEGAAMGLGQELTRSGLIRLQHDADVTALKNKYPCCDSPDAIAARNALQLKNRKFRSGLYQAITKHLVDNKARAAAKSTRDALAEAARATGTRVPGANAFKANPRVNGLARTFVKCGNGLMCISIAVEGYGVLSVEPGDRPVAAAHALARLSGGAAGGAAGAVLGGAAAGACFGAGLGPPGAIAGAVLGGFGGALLGGRIAEEVCGPDPAQ